MVARTEMGLNRTGVQASPIDARRMMTAPGRAEDPSPEGMRLARTRLDYVVEAEPVGSVPLPGTLKGAAQTAVDKLAGKRPELLVDELGERMAFERSGTRLYDALLAKFEAAPGELPGVSRDRLREIRDAEARHFNLVADAMERVGADPTAQTPGADVTGVASLGLLQALMEPRTTLAQGLKVILIAELADQAGWELLIELVREFGLDDLEAKFRRALEEEGGHLREVRRWLEGALLGEQGE
jgi:rubrerythrin